MSIEVTSWVFRHSETTLGRRLVLLVLADHANDDGTGAWPSVATIAEKARLSERQVQRCLRDLVVDKAVEKVGKSASGTTIYNVVMAPAGGDILTPPGEEGVTNRAQEVPKMSPELSEPPIEETAIAVPSQEPPRATLIDGRNLPFDSLAEVCGIRPGSPRLRTIPTALNGDEGIRAQAWRETPLPNLTPLAYENWLAQAIYERAAMYRAKMPGVALTPTALAKWWTDLPGMAAARDGRSGSGAEVVDAVEAAVQRQRERSH